MGHIDLSEIKSNYQKKSATVGRRITVCAGTGCVANGALKVIKALEEKIAEAGIPVSVKADFESHDDKNTHLSGSGCQGFCQILLCCCALHPKLALNVPVTAVPSNLTAWNRKLLNFIERFWRVMIWLHPKNQKDLWW